MAKQVGPATAGGVVTDVHGSGGHLEASSPADTTVAPFVSQVPGTPVHFPSYHGRAVSWVAVSLILVGFVVGGLALTFGLWWLFWVSLGIAAVGGLLGLGTNIFEDWY